jgi:hypothetical protein
MLRLSDLSSPLSRLAPHSARFSVGGKLAAWKGCNSFFSITSFSSTLRPCTTGAIAGLLLNAML